MLTRLHARYGKTIANDFVFAVAKPIVVGREFVRGGGGKLEEGAQPAEQNNFQGRYAVRHAWTGPIACTHPQRYTWVGRATLGDREPARLPAGRNQAGGRPRIRTAREIKLAQVVLRDLPEIGIQAAKDRSGCGCATTGRNDVLGGTLLIGASLLVYRRRQARRA